MPQITNKIKSSGPFAAVLVASMLFASCGTEKQADTSVSDSAEVMEQQMAPDSMAKDSLPALDDSSSTRPEPRKTR